MVDLWEKGAGQRHVVKEFPKGPAIVVALRQNVSLARFRTSLNETRIGTVNCWPSIPSLSEVSVSIRRMAAFGDYFPDLLQAQSCLCAAVHWRQEAVHCQR